MKKDGEDDWLQREIESRKEMEQQREAVARNAEILDKSNLLARVENKKQEIENQTLHRFEIDLIPMDFDPNRVVGYKVRHGSNSFKIEANENGIYLHFSVRRLIRLPGAEQPSIDPHNVLDDEIHDWFGQIVSG